MVQVKVRSNARQADAWALLASTARKLTLDTLVKSFISVIASRTLIQAPAIIKEVRVEAGLTEGGSAASHARLNAWLTKLSYG